MDGKILYLWYRLKWLVKRVAQKAGIECEKPTIYAGKTILSLNEANSYIEKRIRSDEPFAICRFGSVELNAFWRQDSLLPMSFQTKRTILRDMYNNAGFFPADMESVRHFYVIMQDACRQMDAFAVWFNPMEDYAIRAYGEPKEIAKLRALEPWYVDNPWTRALSGKKVLVIHPFKETILKQYNKREKLFDNPNILPEFSALHVIKAVQTIAGNKDERFETWFDALEWMYTEAMKVEFDVAIIGCGAYGLPLTAKIKAAGKQAIHMGGATQLLFGIKGNRWTNHPEISKLFNEYWVFPAETERPKNAKNVENACYW